MHLDPLLPDTEYLALGRDRATGLVAVIAVDDTTLGPALGGIRWRSYPSERAAVAECRRLGRAMSLKNALAGVGFGGGKSVMMASEAVTDRREALLAFGRFVARTGGAYVPAADMGTGVADLRIVRETAGDVSCDDADPSVSTAVGVHEAIKQAVAVTDGALALHGVRVAIQGVGHVGARLASLLARDGARLFIADLDTRRAVAVARDVSGTVVDAEDILAVDCDVLAPCAAPRVLNESTIPHLAARTIVGAANDVLDGPDTACSLAERGIVYVPDFVASAGGVIQVRALRDEWSPERLRAELEAIGERTADFLAQANQTGETPLDVAETAAYARLGRARPPRAEMAYADGEAS